MKKTLETFIHWLFFTCEEVAYRIERQASAKPVGIIEIVRIKGHLAICKWCKVYADKVKIIDQAMLRLTKKTNPNFEKDEMLEFKNALKKSFTS